MGVRVLLCDARKLGYCSRGMREFCITQGLSWDEVLKSGMDSDVLLSLNDAMADRLVEEAEMRECQQNRQAV